MTKILVSSTLAALMLVGFSGCSGEEPKPEAASVPIAECTIDKAEAPSWACGMVTFASSRMISRMSPMFSDEVTFRATRARFSYLDL